MVPGQLKPRFPKDSTSARSSNRRESKNGIKVKKLSDNEFTLNNITLPNSVAEEVPEQRQESKGSFGEMA